MIRLPLNTVPLSTTKEGVRNLAKDDEIKAQFGTEKDMIRLEGL